MKQIAWHSGEGGRPLAHAGRAADTEAPTESQKQNKQKYLGLNTQPSVDFTGQYFLFRLWGMENTVS